MLFASVSVVLTLLGLCEATLRRIGPFGHVEGAGERNPVKFLPEAAHPYSLTCKGSDRLSYLEVLYASSEKVPLLPVGYGDPSQGAQAGPINLDWANLRSLTPYICSGGWFKGTICGLKLEFASHSPVLCGIDDTHGHAYIPPLIGPAKKYVLNHNRLHSFFVNTSPDGRVITKIGWVVQVYGDA